AIMNRCGIFPDPCAKLRRGGAAMDVLGDLLASMRMRCSVLANFSLTAPWGLDCSSLLVGAPLHLVVEGRCWLLRPGGAPLPLGPGDLVALPHWGPHTLASAPDAPAVPLGQAFAEKGLQIWNPASNTSSVLELFWGGGGAETRILSGVAVFEA